MKLRPPELPKGHVVRRRLVDRLERGSNATLTLVAAPAGYGKTTLLAAWLGLMEYQAAWLTLDQQDNDPSVFLWDLFAAIQTVAPDFGRPILGPGTPPGSPSAAVVAASLTHMLAGLEQRIIMVLDDYQAIVNAEVHAIVAALLQRLPAGVQLVLATRQDPPLPLGLLRARGRLLEIGVGELRFQSDEVDALLRQLLGDRPPSGLSEALEQGTEGWAAGLRLAVLALEGQPDPLAWSDQLQRESNRYVQELLLDEVLEQQPPEIQQFLLQTSICERFCVDLCDVLLVGPGPARPVPSILAQLEREQLLVVQPGAGRQWYRYRRLLRDALQQRLQILSSTAAIQALHRRASAWFAAESLVDEALEHALAADDLIAAAEVVERAAQPTLNREDWPRLERWLEHLPDQWVQQRPGLLLAQLWVLYFHYQYAALPPLLEVVERLLARGESEPNLSTTFEALRGEAYTLRSLVSTLEEEHQQARDLAERALQHLPEQHYFVRGLAGLLLGLARHSLGERAAAVRQLADACAGQVDSGPARSTHLLLGITLIHLISCDLQAAMRTARELLAVARLHDLPASSAWGLYFLGRVHYELNQLAAAREYLLEAVALRGSAHHQMVRDSLLSLALTEQALGDQQAAEAAIQSLTNSATAAAWVRDRQLVSACQAHLAFLQGDLTTAAAWARDDTFPVEGSLDSQLESPALIRAELLVLEDGTTAGENASRLLAQLTALYTSRHDDLQTIRCQTVEALLLWVTGEIDAGLDLLGQVVARARGSGLVRTFINLGPSLRGLLLELKRRTVQADPYLDRLLSSFPATSGPTEAAAPSRRDTQPDLVEPLTRRELQILGLLATRQSNKEIARSLQISPETVKKHTISIYQKLMVTGRREAGSRAHTLGLLHGTENS